MATWPLRPVTAGRAGVSGIKIVIINNRVIVIFNHNTIKINRNIIIFNKINTNNICITTNHNIMAVIKNIEIIINDNKIITAAAQLLHHHLQLRCSRCYAPGGAGVGATCSYAAAGPLGPVAPGRRGRILIVLIVININGRNNLASNRSIIFINIGSHIINFDGNIIIRNNIIVVNIGRNNSRIIFSSINISIIRSSAPHLAPAPRCSVSAPALAPSASGTGAAK